VFRHDLLHDLAGVLLRRRAGRSDEPPDQRLERLVRHLLRQIGLEHRELALFLVGELLAPRLLVLLDRVLPLLDRAADHHRRLGVRQLVHLFDLLVLQRSLQHPQSRQLLRFFRLHRGGQVRPDLFCESHSISAGRN
jgi:hypothetical protein